MQVKFLRRYCGYLPGAIPRIDPKLAARLIKGGFCEPLEAKAPAAKETPKSDSDKPKESKPPKRQAEAIRR